MEDRYLYKAKRLDNGEWVEGFMVACDERIFIAQKPECNTNRHMLDGYWMGTYIEIDPSTLCQCTGLKDKNGKLIWENDIILSGYYKWKCKVVWDEACVRFIGLTNDKDVKIVYVDMVDRNNESAVEVIGNIYENPEVLEMESRE